MAKYALPTYKPSGKLKPLTFALFLGGIAAGCVVAVVYQQLIRWIPYIYVNFVLVCGFGGALGVAGWQMVKLGHCRNKVVAAVLALLMGGVALGASYWWDWQRALSDVAEKETGVTREELAQEITFSRFLELKKATGWKIGKTSSSGGITGAGVTTLWVLEALIVLGIALGVTASKAGEPYCEKCGRWCNPHAFFLSHTSRADADPYLQKGDLGGLTQINGRAEADPNVSLHFTVTSCGGCTDTAFLTVAEQTIKQTKKQTNTTKVTLIDHAILPPGQRELAVDRAQAAVGQKLAAS